MIIFNLIFGELLSGMQQQSMSVKYKLGVGHGVFEIRQLRCQSLSFEGKKMANIPSKRYLHSSVIYEDKFYLFGGLDNQSDIKENKMYCLNLKTMKWTTIEIKDHLEHKNSHSTALHRSQIYFFGGAQQQQKPTNRLHKYNPQQNIWSEIPCGDTVPLQRQLALFTSISNEYLFLYGGIDMTIDRIYNDAFLFKNNAWTPLTTINNPETIVRMGMAVCGRKVFCFGGERPSPHGISYSNTLYELVINEFDLSVTFKQIQMKSGKVPCKRTGHGMIAISDKFFLMYGGEGQLQEKEKGIVSEALCDVWLFDIEESRWTEIDILQKKIQPRYEFSLSMNKNSLYIFGGFNDQNVVLDELTTLSFQPQNAQLDICTPCDTQMKNALKSSEAKAVKSLALSNAFYYNMALEIAFPFKAIELILDAAEIMAAQSLKISSAKNIEDLDYLIFDFEPNYDFSIGAFLEMNENPGDNYFQNIFYNIKVGSLRLGKTFIFVNANETTKKVLLMSVDSKYSPKVEERYVCYSYVQDIATGCICPANGLHNKKIIINILKSQVQDPYKLLSRRSGNMLAIFQINIFPTAQKAYYYELVFYSTPDYDVRIYHNEKKSYLLESIGYSIANSLDFSLKNYLKYSRLQRTLKVYINGSQTPTPTESYLQSIFKHNLDEILLQVSLGTFESPYVEKYTIYRCTANNFLYNNQGILIYCNNILIDRYDCKLGHIIIDKFYKKKYKKNKNVFKFVGVIILSSKLKMNAAKTKFVHQFRYGQVLFEIIAKLKSVQHDDQILPEDVDMMQLQKRLSDLREGGRKLKRDQ